MDILSRAGSYPPKFRQRAVELARLREKPIAEASPQPKELRTLQRWACHLMANRTVGDGSGLVQYRQHVVGDADVRTFA